MISFCWMCYYFIANFETSCILSVIWQCGCQNFCALNFNGTAMAWLAPMIRTLASPWSKCASCHQQGLQAVKLLQWDPTVLNWDYQLSVLPTQLDLYYGCTVVVVVSLETLAYWIWPTIMYWCIKINIFSWQWNRLLEGANFIFVFAAVIFWSFSQFKTCILWHLFPHDSSWGLHRYLACWFTNADKCCFGIMNSSDHQLSSYMTDICAL